MSGRSVGFLAIVAVVASAACSSSPTAPERAPAGEPGTLQAAGHLDCDSAEDIRDRIDALEGDGTLNSGRARALRNKLDQAERHEAAGRPDQASEAYAQLIEQVEGWVADGTISEEDMEELLACAEDVLDGPDVSFVAISAGALSHTCGLTATGEAFCWGSNDGGQLGDGNGGTDSDTPVAVLGGHAFTTISAGDFHTCGLTAMGEAFCWGSNAAGELGDGNLGTPSDIPVAVLGMLDFMAISAEEFRTCGVTTDGEAFCWGSNRAGQLGDGNQGTDSDTPVAVLGGHTFTTISAGALHTCGLTTAGAALCWGSNHAGQLGDGTFDESDTPVVVLGGHTFAALSAEGAHACGLSTAGSAFCWGGNHFGQLGDGSGGGSAFSDFPVAVSGGHTFAAISAGQGHTCGMTGTGDAFCWGDNVSGQLGDGNLGTNSHIPIAVLGEHVFEAINAGGLHTCGVTTTGDPFCWGENFHGQLGDGNAPTESDTPVAVAQP